MSWSVSRPVVLHKSTYMYAANQTLQSFSDDLRIWRLIWAEAGAARAPATVPTRAPPTRHLQRLLRLLTQELALHLNACFYRVPSGVSSFLEQNVSNLSAEKKRTTIPRWLWRSTVQ